MSEQIPLAIYEDDPDCVSCLARYLEVFGYKFVINEGTVAGALGTLKKLEDEKVLAAIIDYKFPDGFGDTIALAINESGLSVPLIGNGSQHNLSGVTINILKTKGPVPVKDYLATLR